MEHKSEEIKKTEGSFGRWQMRIVFILILGRFYNSFHFLATTFFNPKVDHWCKPPGELYNNWSVQEWKQYAIPFQKDTNKFSSCEMYNRNYSVYDQQRHEEGNLSVTACIHGWNYDTSHFSHSLENEFDLVCHREALSKTGAAIFNTGIMAGALTTGYLSDTFGRKIAILCSLLVCIVCGIATAVMPILELVFLGRFLLAMGVKGFLSSSYVLMMEYTDNEQRGLVAMYAGLPWVVGYISLGGLAYVVPDWRNLQLIISAQMIPYVAFWWFVPESIHWLISKGKLETAEKIAREGATTNKRSVLVDLKKLNISTVSEKSILLDLFRYPVTRRYTLIMIYTWFVNVFVYYGLTLGTADIGGNLFVTFILSGLVELPVYLTCGWIINLFGRRIPYCIFTVIGGIACIATSAFEKGSYTNDWPIISLAMVSKLCSTATFSILYVYTVELYPTPVRNISLALSSTSGRVGSILAPFVFLLQHIHAAVPLLVLAASSISTVVLFLFLPETNNKPLPQSFEDIETLM